MFRTVGEQSGKGIATKGFDLRVDMKIQLGVFTFKPDLGKGVVFRVQTIGLSDRNRIDDQIVSV
jgi:hypothetical protein